MKDIWFPREQVVICSYFIVKTLLFETGKKADIVQNTFIPMQVYIVPGWSWNTNFWCGPHRHGPTTLLVVSPWEGKPRTSHSLLHSRIKSAFCMWLWIKPSCWKNNLRNIQPSLLRGIFSVCCHCRESQWKTASTIKNKLSLMVACLKSENTRLPTCPASVISLPYLNNFNLTSQTWIMVLDQTWLQDGTLNQNTIQGLAARSRIIRSNFNKHEQSGTTTPKENFFPNYLPCWRTLSLGLACIQSCATSA